MFPGAGLARKGVMGRRWGIVNVEVMYTLASVSTLFAMVGVIRPVSRQKFERISTPLTTIIASDRLRSGTPFSSF
jgi:hypothetical protein